MQLYYQVQGKTFRLIHCYRISVQCPKWKPSVDTRRSTNNVPRGSSAGPSAGPSAGSCTALVLARPDDTLELSTRPLGRKQEKTRSGKKNDLGGYLDVWILGQDQMDRRAEKRASMMEEKILVSKKRAKAEDASHDWAVMITDSTTIADPARRAWVEEYQALIMAKKNRFVGEAEEAIVYDTDSI
ncbi:hypothetical protein [Absidia glauca]|uniref:No apical meristem-associated C-terminal domain-containing protein n=1 Tax=Absidia glauca TaxID=4829 RepID=A0A163J2M8_ABSGL|nr:hypothetical protein [Absidia glauca]